MKIRACPVILAVMLYGIAVYKLNWPPYELLASMQQRLHAEDATLTPEEFFAWVPGQEGRYELVDGEVKAGDYVVLSAFLTNREPEFYAEPDRFKPERWAHIDPTQFEYLAFSAGPRTCIGARFASNVLRIAVGRIMQLYRLEIAPGARIDQKVRLTLRPGRNGIPVSIHRQDRRFKASAIGGNIRRIVRFDA